MVCTLLLTLLSTLAVQEPLEVAPKATESLAAVAARADELMKCAQQCPLDTLRRPGDNHLSDYIKGKNLSLNEFFLGETLYLMKLINVIDLRDIDYDPLFKLFLYQMRSLSDGFLPAPPTDSEKVLCNQVIAYCLVTDYGGAPEAYRFWLLRQLPFLPRAKGDSIDLFLTDCMPTRTIALDVNLTRALLCHSVDTGGVKEMCKSRLLVPQELPDKVETFLNQNLDAANGPQIRECVNTLVERKSPVLDVFAAYLLKASWRATDINSEWHEFMMSRAPVECRVEYLWRSCGGDSSSMPLWQKKADILSKAVGYGMTGFSNFDDLPYGKGEELKVIPAAVGENDLSATLMRGVGHRWSSYADAHDSETHQAYLDVAKRVAADNNLLHDALCAIEQYVMGVRGGKSPEAERVISEILDRAVASPDKKTEVLARIIKQRAIAYGRLMKMPDGCTGWSFVEAPTYRSGIDMVDYLYLMIAPDAR